MANQVNKDAIVRFLTGYEDNLSEVDIENGTVYFALKPDPLNPFTKTIGSIYLDANNQRIMMSGESLATLDEVGDRILTKYIKGIDFDANSNAEATNNGAKGILTYVKGNGADVNVDVPSASASAAGFVTTGSQTFAGTKTFNSPLIPLGGSYVHSATGTSGTPGYVKIATFKINGTYQNTPIVIELVDRVRKGSCVLNIQFQNVNSNDPTLATFTFEGVDYNCYLYKSATSTWDLYVKKREAYGQPTVVRFHKSPHMSKVAVIWTNAHADTIPSEAQPAVLGGNVANASNADFATKSTGDGQGNNIYTTYLSDLTSTNNASIFTIQGIKKNGGNSPTTITINGATTEKAGLVTTGAQTFAGTKTFTGIVHLSNKTDASGASDSGVLIIGDKNGEHLIFDGNEIMSKNKTTGTGTLYLNNDGGTIQVGGSINPNSNKTLNLGSATNYWKEAYISNLITDTLSGHLTGSLTGNVTGNASSATKLQTARKIILGNDLQGEVSFDGTKNVTFTASNYYSTIGGGNTQNYPWRRIATSGTITGSRNDRDMVIAIRHSYNGGGYGIAKVSLRTNNVSSNAVSQCEIRWLVRQNIALDALQAGFRNVAGDTYADIFYKVGAWPRARVYQLQGDRTWTLISSNEANDTTTSDKKTSSEAYATIAAAATALNRTYTSTVTAVDQGYVERAYKDESGNNIKASYLAAIQQVTSDKDTFTFRGFNKNNGAMNNLITIPGATAADANNANWKAGLVTSQAQTWAGNKTFKGALTVAARATVDTLKISKTEMAKHIEFARGGFNYIATTANGCIAFLPNGASTGEETSRLIVEDGGARPGATNTYNLGTSGKRWKNIYGNVLNISGTSTLTGAVTLGGNLSVGGTLGVTRATTLSSTLTVTGKTVLSSVVEIGNDLTVTGAIFGKGKLTIGQADLNTNYTVYVNGSSYFKGNVTSNGTLHLTNTTNSAASSDPNVALVIGNRAAQHLLIDDRGIQSKKNGTAADTLSLNPNGGTTLAGGNIQTASTFRATGLDKGYQLYRNSVSYGHFYVDTDGAACTTDGTTGTAGVAILTLGNSTAQSSTLNSGANNAYGVVRLYSVNTGYGDIRYVYTADKRTYYISNHGATAYSLGRDSSSKAYGSTVKPVWFNSSGMVTAFVDTVGSTAKPIYMSGGSLTECSANVGASNNPVYMNDGTITESNSSIGGSTTPMYLLNGIMTSCDYEVGALHATDIFATDDKVYLLGTSSSSTGYRTTTYFDTEIYITTTLGELSCARVESRGNLYGGNNIYLRHGTYGEYARLFVDTSGTACTTDGTAGATGVTYMHLGNSIAVSTAAGHGNGNSCGVLRIYGSNTGYTDIRCGSNNTSECTLYLPGGTGQIVFHTNNIPIGGPDTPVCVTATGRVMPCSTNLTDYVLKAGDTMTGNLAIKKASGTASFTTERTDTKVSVLFGVGSDGTNRGVYDNSLARWIIYSDGTDAAKTGLKLCGAVWNDYAEFRQTKDKVEPGRVVIETGRGDLKLSTERLQPGANVVSDTFGFAIGETKKAKTPLAVAGRVLVYTFEDKYSYKPGDAVCTGPNGTVSKMTREEIWKYPERIVGTVSEIPEYEIWESGDGPIQVNSRIWIKVK